ncbi:MAG: hemin-degrading factor [Pusillimonas sp.]
MSGTQENSSSVALSSALATAPQGVALRERYAAFAADQPGLRRRNMAECLGVTELELVAAHCGDVGAVLLKSPPQAIFRELGRLGRVMALTRNDHCVHERHGQYEDIKAGEQMGIVLGPDIDLRVFFSDWATTLAVNEAGRRSLQFFDAAGTALHKVFLTDASDISAYETLVAGFADPDPVFPVVRPLAPKAVPATTQVSEELRADWLAMKDTHEFHGLLKRYDIARLRALEGIGPDLAQQVSNDHAERMLSDVAERDIPFMCFVGNHGIIQIHSGPVKVLKRTGPWFNVLEPHFNLHLDTTGIVSTWVVNKPSEDGWITSLECFDGRGELVVQFFGVRKPGIPELAPWRSLMMSYCTVPLAS